MPEVTNQGDAPEIIPLSQPMISGPGFIEASAFRKYLPSSQAPWESSGRRPEGRG